MEDKIIINTVDPQTFEFQDYSTSDSELIAINQLDTVFSSSTDYIEAYIYDENQNQISSVVPFTSYSVTEGDVVLKPSNDLERLGFDIGSYYITYDFYRPRLASTLNTRYYISEISADRTEIRLDSTQIDNLLLISSSLEFIEYRDTSEYFVDFFLNFGNNQQVIANNIELSLEDETNPTVLIKLYEALPSSFDLKSQCSVVEQISTPQSYNVVFPPLEFTADDFTYISGPNFSLNISNQSGVPGMDFSYSTLVESNQTSSFNQINNLLNRKEISINVNYEDYTDFVYFSSAYTRLENFYSKVGLIQSASAQIGQITTSTSASVAYSSSQAFLASLVKDTIQNFDGYEYFLYFDSGSQYSYPKSNTEPPFVLYPTGSTEALTWLGTTDSTDVYYGGQAVSASEYDETNTNSLYYSIPEYLRSDPQNAKYELFVDMVGQHYDNLWLYTKNLTSKFDADNRLDYGISKDLVADAIRDFGIKLYSNNFNTNDLYTAFLGLTPSGSSFPFPYMTGSIGGVVDTPSGYEYVDTTISASNDIVPLDDVNKRLYKRIYHNLPYLLKTKGTIAGLRALITSYGIPDTILRINEFGDKDRNNSQDWDLKQNIYNKALDTTSTEITSSFTLNSDFNADLDRPQTIQFRFKTEGIPTGSSNPVSQSFFFTDAYSTVALALEYDESLIISGSYSGSTPSDQFQYGILKFWPNEDVNPTNTASLSAPFWDGGWWTVQLSWVGSWGDPSEKPFDGDFKLEAANKIGENIGFYGSDIISADDTPYEQSNTIFWLPNSTTILAGGYYSPFTGSVQEIRYYSEYINQNTFYDYVMNPYSFEGSGTNTSPNELAFRLPLGSLLNTGSLDYKNSIHPKVTGSWVTTSSFLNESTASFSSTPSWLNNYESIYLDQTPSGMRNRVTDKIQTEAMILPEGDTLSAFTSIQQTSFVSESFTPSVNYLEVAFSPQDQINDDIIGQMGYFNIGDYIGDPRLISSSNTNYPDLDTLRDSYFEKYINNYNVVDFIRLIKFFDNSLFKMIEDFTPARTSLSSGVVVKQHLLERNRQRPALVTSSFHDYSGSVKSQARDYSEGSGDTGQYEYENGTSVYRFSGGTAGSFEPFNGLQTSISGTLGNGPDNRYHLTQSWEESWVTLSGSAPIPRIDQREFYNGEFSGSVVNVRMKDMCSAYFKVSNTIYSFIPVWWNNSTFPEQNFTSPTNQPPPGYVWFWTDTNNTIYIKLSLQTHNGLSIGNFIQNVEYVVFNFTNALDSEDNILSGPQTFYLESIAIQPSDQASNELSVGAALGYTVPEISSLAINSDDGTFFDFNFFASGDYIWPATSNIELDPAPTLDTGISASVPQGYFPAENFPTESFFRGWANSNFYTLGTFSTANGVLNDVLDNFNTGSREIDNTDTTPLGGIDPQSNFSWFMNAGTDTNSGYIHITSESFLDYSGIPDASYGPVSTNNYFNIAFVSESGVNSTQGVNYYYNASNNVIYISGSEFQNELKQTPPIYSGSLVSRIIDNSGNTPSSYTPIGQTSLSIPIDLSRGQELWVYQGENDGNPYQGSTFVGYDKNSWRYNRYIHRPYKIYYVTETGSGAPGEPYEPYLPMTSFSPFNAPTYYHSNLQNGTSVTMLGTQTDLPTSRARDYFKYLNGTGTAPSVDPVSGSFIVYNDLRQIKPFLYTTYTKQNPTPVPFNGLLIGSGSYVSISQSDGTPFARLQMRQVQSVGVNPDPYFYNNNPFPDVEVGDIVDANINIGYGANWDGLNTSSLSLTTGTQPGGSTTDTDIVFPPGSYIFTMSAFDNNQYSAGRTEFGLWTKYGDYVTYDFENQPGSGINPAVISYKNTSLANQSTLIYVDALNVFDGNFINITNNKGVGIGDAISGNSGYVFYGTKYERFNVDADGNYTINVNRTAYASNTLELWVGNNQAATGDSTTGMILKHSFPTNITSTQTWVGPVTSGQQILLLFNHFENFYAQMTFNNFYLSNLSTPTPKIAKIGSPVVTSVFNEPYVITGSIISRYQSGVAVPSNYATKITDAYVVYSSSLSSSLAGGYLFDVVPTQTNIYITASVKVSSYSETANPVYGQAIYGVDLYGGGSGGGVTWPTASLILYTGSANNFPNEMPIAGGNVFAQTSSYSVTHHVGEIITLHAELNSTDISYNDVIKMAVKVESGSYANTFVENSLIVTEYSMSFSSSINPNLDPSIPAVFDNDSNLPLDCQPLLNNFSEGRINRRLQDVDYSTDILTPSNWQQIIDFSASRASVPESNYTKFSVANSRYWGTKSTSERINNWTVGDTGTYGKLPNIEVTRGFLAFFDKTVDLYPVLNNKTLYNVQYLIGQDGIAKQPKLSETTLYNMQGTFDSYPEVSRGIVSLNKPENEALNGLNGNIDFYKVTQRPTPVLYTQQSNLFAISSSYDAGELLPQSGIDLIGNEPVDATIVPTFDDYTVDATGNGISSQTNNFSSVPFIAPVKFPTTDGFPYPNTTASLAKTTGLDVYSTTTGLLSIPYNDARGGNTAGVGNSTSQPYELNVSLGIDTTPLTYAIQTSNPNKGGGYNTSGALGSLNIKFQRALTYGGAMSTIRPNNVKVTLTNFYAAQGGGGQSTVTYDFGTLRPSQISNSSTSGVTIGFDAATIKGVIQQSGQSPQAVQEGGSLLKQRWTISGTIPASSIKQGYQFRTLGGGQLISGASQADPALNPNFFPSTQGGVFVIGTNLEGGSSSPVTSALGPYWVFSGSSTNVLICDSDQLNKGYNRGFIQKDLVYTSSRNKDFPGGNEPEFSQFPKITEQWSLEPYDEIRFLNDERYSYTITSIIAPSEQEDLALVSGGTGKLVITLDGNVPQSFETSTTQSTGGVGIALDAFATQSLYTGDDNNTVVASYKKVEYGVKTGRPLDFFLIRRYVSDASSLITNQQFPYLLPVTTASSTGFISPEYPTEKLKTDPDLILRDLTDKKLIE